MRERFFYLGTMRWIKRILIGLLALIALANLSPNTATKSVNIEFELYDMSSAVLIFTNTFTTNSYQVPVFENLPAPFDISNFQNGIYAVQLVVDGVLCDQKFLIKQ